MELARLVRGASGGQQAASGLAGVGRQSGRAFIGRRRCGCGAPRGELSELVRGLTVGSRSGERSVPDRLLAFRVGAHAPGRGQGGVHTTSLDSTCLAVGERADERVAEIQLSAFEDDEAAALRLIDHPGNH